jgi:hypothetical protein
MAMATDTVPNYHLVGAGCGTQVFPYYTYAEDGTHHRENITDWAREQFRARYHDPSITKWDIFHYVYAVLHHPEYRERYAVPTSAANCRAFHSRAPTLPQNCHPERSRGTPRLPIPSSGLERSSLYEVRPAAFMVRTPLHAGWHRRQTRGLSTPQRDSQTNPFTRLKMTRKRAKTVTCSVRSQEPDSAWPTSTSTTNNNPNTSSRK